MKVFNQEANVDDVVQNIISIIEASPWQERISDTSLIERCECGMPKFFGVALCAKPGCGGDQPFRISEQ